MGILLLVRGAECQKDLVCQLIQSNDYECEVHKVLTEDGYQLTLHRIPPVAKEFSNRTLAFGGGRGAFVLMHGLIGSASDFILPGRDKALASLLHEQGYDVWLPNARGTTHSKRHLDMDSSMPSFWNFTWHEMGYYDLPAVVDYVMNATGVEKVHYVAHSQGSTVFFVLLSERPEYNERFATVSLLAPVAFLGNLKSPPMRLLAKDYRKVEVSLEPKWRILGRRTI